MSKTVLVVDDEPDIVLTVRVALELAGYRVLSVETGEDALELLEREQPDVVLLDLRLPGIGGFAVLERLPQRRAPVIVLSAHASSDTRRRAIEMGCTDFITKPFDPAMLVAQVERALTGVPRP